jgi:hypothetical protein
MDSVHGIDTVNTSQRSRWKTVHNFIELKAVKCIPIRVTFFAQAEENLKATAIIVLSDRGMEAV